MTLDRLWADWRAEYVTNADGLLNEHGCVICNLVKATDDAEALVLERTDTTITVMNLFPYGSGHLMVAPTRHTASFVDLHDEETVAVARAQLRALRAINDAYGPDGANVGANIGRAGGAGVPGHLHVHLLPRWNGDTNFMTSIAEARVLPESLRAGYDKLNKVWPR
jgi:ATP adenylyltransferase